MNKFKLLKDLQVGDQVDENIYNLTGQLLVAKGKSISDRVIEVLKRNNITGAFISNTSPEEIIISPVQRKEIRDKLISKITFSNFELIDKDMFNDLIEMGIIYFATKKKNEVN